MPSRCAAGGPACFQRQNMLRIWTETTSRFNATGLPGGCLRSLLQHGNAHRRVAPLPGDGYAVAGQRGAKDVKRRVGLSNQREAPPGKPVASNIRNTEVISDQFLSPALRGVKACHSRNPICPNHYPGRGGGRGRPGCATRLDRARRRTELSKNKGAHPGVIRHNNINLFHITDKYAKCPPNNTFELALRGIACRRISANPSSAARPGPLFPRDSPLSSRRREFCRSRKEGKRFWPFPASCAHFSVRKRVTPKRGASPSLRRLQGGTRSRAPARAPLIWSSPHLCGSRRRRRLPVLHRHSFGPSNGEHKEQ